MTFKLFVFLVLAVLIVAGSVLAVTSKRILRAATYLLFVLIGTAGLYFLLNYTFLGAVQLSVYAGGIMVLFVFAIVLTAGTEEKVEKVKNSKLVAGIGASVAGIVLALCLLLNHNFIASNSVAENMWKESSMIEIGNTMMGSDKFQYVLPFEVISILLLACIVGGLVIAQKDKKEK